MMKIFKAFLFVALITLFSASHAVHGSQPYLVGEIKFEDNTKGYVIILNQSQYDNTLRHWQMDGPFSLLSAPFEKWFYALTDRRLCPQGQKISEQPK